MSEYLQIFQSTTPETFGRSKIGNLPFYYDKYGVYLFKNGKLYTIGEYIRNAHEIATNLPKVPTKQEINTALKMISDAPNMYHDGEQILKIDLIKNIRQITQWGLKDAKDLADHLVEKNYIKVIGGRLQITFP